MPADAALRCHSDKAEQLAHAAAGQSERILLLQAAYGRRWRRRM